ncbi:MAG: hypothetical protein HYU67_08405 [Flavobacteriia bacterium]|nr:hypothetical protein [Flavobacteriia bacterium]
MKKEFQDELALDVKLKMKKNLVYVSIFSIVMIFAGFTSAYLVSMGDSFWLKYTLPVHFWLSTLSIVLSSVFYILAIYFMKKNKIALLRFNMVITLFLGVLFVFFQMKGYKELDRLGANAKNPIMVSEGLYGDDFEISYLNQFIEVDGNKYLLNNKVLNQKQLNELKEFMSKFNLIANKNQIVKLENDSRFQLYHKGKPLVFQNNTIQTIDGAMLKYIDLKKLQYLAWNIRDGRGDFFFLGELGKDFNIFYKGKQLEYKERNLYYNNRILSPFLQLKIKQSNDTASSYFYIITFLHLIHVFFTLFYLIKMVSITFRSSLTVDNQISIKMGAIFWHFLGILWLYLLLFLIFIH